MEAPPSLADGQIGVIGYPSASPFEIHHILCKMDSVPHHPVFGSLLIPEHPVSEPMPCVVAVHGSLNWRGHHHEHIVGWLEAGFAVFRVHSFDSRLIESTVEDQMSVTYAMMLTDVYQALRMVSTHPRIDSARIGIAGWSLGGTVALYSAWEPLAEALAPDGERFAAHLPLYPAAHLRMDDQRWSKSPILVLHGDEDDWVPLSLVEGLVEDIRPHGANIEVHVYEDAQHSFDSIESLSFDPKAIRLDGHRTIRIDMQGDMSSEIMPGVVIPLNEPEERLAAFAAVPNLGVHKGGQWTARRHALGCSTEFFQRNLSA